MGKDTNSLDNIVAENKTMHEVFGKIWGKALATVRDIVKPALGSDSTGFYEKLYLHLDSNMVLPVDSDEVPETENEKIALIYKVMREMYKLNDCPIKSVEEAKNAIHTIDSVISLSDEMNEFEETNKIGEGVNPMYWRLHAYIAADALKKHYNFQ
jgi:hypothetical protein